MSKHKRNKIEQQPAINQDAPLANPEVTDAVRDAVVDKIMDLITDAAPVIENLPDNPGETETKVESTGSTKVEVPTEYKGETYPQMRERLGTKSAVIRYLNKERWTNGQIAKFVGIRYQHVFNVLKNPLKTPQ